MYCNLCKCTHTSCFKAEFLMSFPKKNFLQKKTSQSYFWKFSKISMKEFIFSKNSDFSCVFTVHGILPHLYFPWSLIKRTLKLLKVDFFIIVFVCHFMLIWLKFWEKNYEELSEHINIDKYYDIKDLDEICKNYFRYLKPKITGVLEKNFKQILSESYCQNQPTELFCEKRFS